jgi:hypothetical protein
LEICVNEGDRRMVGENNELVRGWERRQRKLKHCGLTSVQTSRRREPERESNLGANLEKWLVISAGIGIIKKD